MIATFSTDHGATWKDAVILRDDFQRDRFNDADLGYARVIRRADGKLVACYYWATAQSPHQHIAATIWNPGGHAEPSVPGGA
jgi:hypothetical protein